PRVLRQGAGRGLIAAATLPVEPGRSRIAVQYSEPARWACYAQLYQILQPAVPAAGLQQKLLFRLQHPKQPNRERTHQLLRPTTPFAVTVRAGHDRVP